MEKEFSTKSFIKAIPGMAKKVWPGFWILITIITLSLFFANSPLEMLSFSDWLTMHILIVAGLICLTICFYNVMERYLANLATTGVWLLASAMCVFAEILLRSL